ASATARCQHYRATDGEFEGDYAVNRSIADTYLRDGGSHSRRWAWGWSGAGSGTASSTSCQKHKHPKHSTCCQDANDRLQLRSATTHREILLNFAVAWWQGLRQ